VQDSQLSREFVSDHMNATLIALVTGANKGIGLEICRQLLQANVSVVLTSRSVERGQAATSLLRREEENGHLVAGFVQLDVADDTSVEKSVDKISELVGGKLDILVNNAGIAFRDDTFGAAEAFETVNVNTLGTIRVTRALLPLLSGKEEGGTKKRKTAAPSAARIVNVASIESDLSQSLSKPLQRRFLADALDDEGIRELMMEFVDAVGKGTQRRAGWKGTMYHASKVGQMAFAQVLTREMARSGSKHITVVSCCPGFVKTDMSSFCYGPGQGHKTPAQGADTPVWLALMHGHAAQQSHGKFFTHREEIDWI